MFENNASYVFLLGFSNLHNFNTLLFLLLLIIYCITICGNVLIIILVTMNRNLHSPMYFFITQVSFLDILMATDIVPVLLQTLLYDCGTMSLSACITQLYVFGNIETSECPILMAMSYDRYVAICNPLRYYSIISKTFCITSVIVSWLLSFLMTLINAVATCKLDFCGPNIIDHFFCDFTPVVELSCSDTSLVKIQTTLFGIIVVVCPCILIMFTYSQIIKTILRISSFTGRQKVFSTCSSHLIVVSIFFGSLFSIYILPAKGQLLTISKVLSLIYTVLTPFLNPFIYSLRNKDLIKAFKKLQMCGEKKILSIMNNL